MRGSRLILIGFFLAGCGRTIAEKEPNDDFDAATPATGNCRVKGTIANASDVDVFRLDAPEGVLSVRVGGVKGADVVIGVFDKDRHELKRFDETSVGGDEQAVDIGVSREAYYVKISNKNPKAGAQAQPYELRVLVEPAADREREPNDTPAAASPLEAGSSARGHYFPSQNLLAGDTEYIEADWYRVNVGQSGSFLLNIDVSEVPGVDGLLEVYDSNAYRLKLIDGSGPAGPESYKNLAMRGPTQILLRLRAKNRAANPDAPYQLLTELLPYEGKAEFEPNDQRTDATPLERDSVAGNIAPVGDADWYRIRVATDARQILAANLSALPGMDLQLVVADALGQPIRTIDNMGKEQPETLTGLGVGQGEYYLVVSEKSGKLSEGRSSYALTKALAPFDPRLEYELNDSSETAQAVKVGESMDGYVAPKGDVDYYEFNVYQKGTMVIEVTGVINIHMSLALYDQEYQELLSQAAKKAGEPLTIEKELDAGTYALRLMAVDPNENNVRDKYTLRLRVR